MTADTVPLQNGVVIANGEANHSATTAKKSKESERRRHRRKQKKSKTSKQAMESNADNGNETDGDEPKEKADSQLQAVEQVIIEYEAEKAELEDGIDDEFRKIFDKFRFRDAAGSEEDNKKDESAQNPDSKKNDDSEDNQQKEKGVCNKKKKLQRRRTKLAQLKQICESDVVEVWDATAADPKLLLFLKAYRNTVPVPRHWCQKRKFLQGTHGIQKKPFQLPDFIAATGIEKIRQAYIEKQDSNKFKQKQREHMQPKMEKMDIDYQVLHDAFFKYQTKPKLTNHGDLYYEGKEFEVKLREMKKPDTISQELKQALGKPDGAPPPWLINMQRYGPPPSYPHLKIPELNAPLKHKHWGDLEEEEEEEEQIDGKEELEDGIQSIDTLSSSPTGDETPEDVIDLRKRKEPERPPLYQVMEEKQERIAPGTLFGTTHTYVTLQPEELEAMDNVLPVKYEQAREEAKLRSQLEDFSNMVAENEKKKKHKMQQKNGKSKKKDFNF
ncbi:hypothetical protein EZV62_000768 [Acer yangbiense]|uniref:PSP proline-rich domain-containing protein n=1 Tax=Acer yangbiense TaxID=1000413 RepID=A0A5C7ISV0_9ROSI|nr:hypothetical protein EZV62_000768 [Acer yangbiense]